MCRSCRLGLDRAHRFEGPHMVKLLSAESGECLRMLGETAQDEAVERGVRRAPPHVGGHQNGVCSAAVSPHGRAVLTTSRDRTAKPCSAESGECLPTLVIIIRSEKGELSPLFMCFSYLHSQHDGCYL